jgi:hypothetical protein
MSRPLKEKARPGSQGSKRGVRTAPAMIAARRAEIEERP